MSYVPSLRDYGSYFAAGEALNTYIASSAGRDVSLIVASVTDPLPESFVIRCSERVVAMLRVGGSTNVPPEEGRELFRDTSRLVGGDPEQYPFQVLRVGAMSGGTRGTDGSLLAPTGHWTCCEVPGQMWTAARQYTDDPDLLPLTSGTTPRTSKALGYGGRYSTLSLDEEGGRTTVFNPMLHVEMSLQVDPTQPATWDLDLPMFVAMLKLYMDTSVTGFSGHLTIGGGGVTAKEIYLCLKNGIPCLVLNGTGRVADWAGDLLDGRMHPEAAKNAAVREQFEAILGLSEEDRRYITVVDRTDCLEGQRWLQAMGIGLIL